MFYVNEVRAWPVTLKIIRFCFSAIADAKLTVNFSHVIGDFIDEYHRLSRKYARMKVFQFVESVL